MLKPVLLVLHQEHSSPGRVGQVLTKLGHPLDVRRPRFGDPLPETMDNHAAAVIFGGPNSANDADDFIKRETDWIGVPLREGKPFLGICLGAQMMARHLGAQVYPHPEGHAEVGYYPIRPTASGRKSAANGQTACISGIAKASSYRRRRAVGGRRRVPDTGDALRQRLRAAVSSRSYARNDVSLAGAWRAPPELPGAKQRAEHVSDRFVYDLASRQWLSDFIDHWIGRKSRSIRRCVLMALFRIDRDEPIAGSLPGKGAGSLRARRLRYSSRNGTQPHDSAAAQRDLLRSSDGLLEVLPISTFLCDAEGRILQFNQPRLEIWGRAPAPGQTHVRSSSVPSCYGPDGTPAATSLLADVLATGRPGAERIARAPPRRQPDRRSSKHRADAQRRRRSDRRGDCMVDVTERERMT